MKKTMLFGITLAAITLLIGCEKEPLNGLNKISGSGEIITKHLELATISNVELEGVANLYVTVGNGQSVTLKAQQNIIDVLNWEVSAGILTISMDEGITIHNHEEIRIEVVVNELFDVVHDGVGDVTLNGISDHDLSIDFRGVGNIDAYDLPVENCTVYSSGLGDCKVNVSGYLEVDISSAGNVYYIGNPEISSTDTGLGDLINDN